MKDNATDGTGGFAMIKEGTNRKKKQLTSNLTISSTNHRTLYFLLGGIRYKHVVIYFKSQSGKDIRFRIDIYAEPSFGIPVTSSYGIPPYPNNVAIPPYPNNVAYPSNAAVPPYPNNAAVPPAGWIYPANTYQPQQQPYVFNRN